MTYELIEAKGEFSCIQNEWVSFGIKWFDDNGEEIGVDWFATEEERDNAIDRWYANFEDTTVEQ